MPEFPFDCRHFPSGPYDSPMEEWFLHHLVKYLAPNATYDDHVPIETRCGCFIVDYVVRVAGRSVAFEVDGRDFHQDGLRDEFRDAALLETGKLDVIWRLSAGNLYRYPNDCLYAVARADPEVISDRGYVNLCRLVHADAKQSDISPDSEAIHMWVFPWEDEAQDNDGYEDDFSEGSDEPQDRRRFRHRNDYRAPYTILIRRRRRTGRIAQLIDIIRQSGGGSLSVVMEAVRPKEGTS
jgi:hypothetical protein